MDDKRGPITLALSCERYYLAGFPLLVAIELHNVTANLFESFEPFGSFNGQGPVEFVLRGNGHEWTWPEKAPRMDGEPSGVDFPPGQVWLALQDLSELHPDLPPGHYTLSASVLFGGGVHPSATASFEIRAPSEKDRAAVARLRAGLERKPFSWRTFVRDNWSTPDVSGLSSGAHAHLAYYLYLHRVTYGPLTVAALDAEEPRKFGHGVLEGEAALARLEILRAAKKPEADGVEKAVLERWPGLAWRVQEIGQGQGLLTGLRTAWGVEREDVPSDRPRPYQR